MTISTTQINFRKAKQSR